MSHITTKCEAKLPKLINGGIAIFQIPLKACEEVPVEKCETVVRTVCSDEQNQQEVTAAVTSGSASVSGPNCRQVVKPVCSTKTRRECTQLGSELTSENCR